MFNLACFFERWKFWSLHILTWWQRLDLRTELSMFSYQCYLLDTLKSWRCRPPGMFLPMLPRLRLFSTSWPGREHRKSRFAGSRLDFIAQKVGFKASESFYSVNLVFDLAEKSYFYLFFWHVKFSNLPISPKISSPEQQNYCQSLWWKDFFCWAGTRDHLFRIMLCSSFSKLRPEIPAIYWHSKSF